MQRLGAVLPPRGQPVDEPSVMMNGETTRSARRASPQDASAQYNCHRTDRPCHDAAHERAANAKLDPEPVQQGAPDKRPRQAGDHVLQETGASDDPAGQPSSDGTDADLNRDGTLVESRQRLLIDADPDRRAEPGLDGGFLSGAGARGNLLG